MANKFGTAVAVRIARVLYRRWEALSPEERKPLESLAGNVKERALAVRGEVDDGAPSESWSAPAPSWRRRWAPTRWPNCATQLRRELERVDREQRARRAA